MSKRAFGIVMVFTVVIAACGSSGGSSGSGAYGGSTTKKTTSTTAASTDATSTTLQLVDTTLGKLVADSAGKTLYLYVPDGTSMVSKVDAGTLAAWPPVQASATPTLGPGLTAEASTAKQPNGENWVTYNGHLLYGFTGDAKPGDVAGNGLGNVWYAVTAAGEPVQS